MNWYQVFYWLSRADDVKSFFDVTSNIFCFFTVIFFIIVIITNIGKSIQISEDRVSDKEAEETEPDIRAWNVAKEYSTKLFYPFLIIMLITWTLYVMIPSKKDCLLIIAGGSVGNFITTDSSSRQIPADVSKFLHLSLQKQIVDLNSETRAELGVQTPRQKMIDKLKGLTKDEIIKYLQEDTTSH